MNTPYAELPPESMTLAYDSMPPPAGGDPLLVGVAGRSPAYTRRTFTKFLAVGGLIGAGMLRAGAEFAADHPEVLRLFKPKIHMYEGMNDVHFPNSYAFLIPGFNCDYQEDLGEAFSMPGNTFAKVGRIEMSSTGINIDEIAETIHTHVKEHMAAPDVVSRRGADRVEISLYGHSTGGPVALQVAAVLKMKYGIIIPEIFLDCAPAKLSSVKRGQGWLKALAGAPDKVIETGGKLLRFITETLGSKDDENSWPDCINIGERKITEADGMSMKLLKDQAIEICDEKWRSVIPHLQDVRMTYFRPGVSSHDHTVVVDEAFADYHAVFPQLQDCRIPHGSHAAINNDDCRAEYGTAIVDIAKRNPKLKTLDNFYQASKRGMMMKKFD